MGIRVEKKKRVQPLKIPERKERAGMFTEHVWPAVVVVAAAAVAVSCPIASPVIAGPFPNCAASRC